VVRRYQRGLLTPTNLVASPNIRCSPNPLL
jgi:hypothetical protein